MKQPIFGRGHGDAFSFIFYLKYEGIDEIFPELLHMLVVPFQA